MRQTSTHERGSANWPFIITLLLLLVFAYMWFDEMDRRENAETEKATAEEQETEARAAASEILDYLVQLSERVGWTDKFLADVVQNAEAKALASDFPVTDLEKLNAHTRPDGSIDGTPGLLNYLINEAEVTVRSDLLSGERAGEVKEVSFGWMTPELREQLARISGMQVPTPPKPALDEDDPNERARYASELQAYEEALGRLQQEMERLASMEGFEEYSDSITGPSVLNPDSERLVKLELFVRPPSGEVTIETLVSYPKMVIDRFKQEFSVNKTADATTIEQLRADIDAKQGEITAAQEALSQEQGEHVSDVQQLQSELADANRRADSAQLEYTRLQNRVQELEEEMKDQAQVSSTRISALENRIRVDKEVRDLEIRRDDPDGLILTSSPGMRTAVINLGSQDKVFPGLKFQVSRIGKGGVRVAKGEVMVTRVLGADTAKVAILGESDPGSPIVGGDLISNPFYSATESINIVLVDALERYPRDIAEARLRRMNVTIQERPNGDTDYIVIPNDMAAPRPETGEDDEMDEDMEPGQQTELDRIQNLARQFGATVITERMLNEFLDY